jgi:hypothetical protein
LLIIPDRGDDIAGVLYIGGPELVTGERILSSLNDPDAGWKKVSRAESRINP